MAGTKSFNPHHATPGIHTGNNFKVNGAGRQACKKYAPPFFSQPFHRYEERSEVIDPSFQEMRFFCGVGPTLLESGFYLFVNDMLGISKQWFSGQLSA